MEIGCACVCGCVDESVGAVVWLWLYVLRYLKDFEAHLCVYWHEVLLMWAYVYVFVYNLRAFLWGTWVRCCKSIYNFLSVAYKVLLTGLWSTTKTRVTEAHSHAMTACCTQIPNSSPPIRPVSSHKHPLVLQIPTATPRKEPNLKQLLTRNHKGQFYCHFNLRFTQPSSSHSRSEALMKCVL